MNKSRTNIKDILAGIVPYDESERATIADVASWVDGTDDLWRRRRPDVPNRHLVSYCVLVDAARQQILLMHHLKAGLWLPPGGHVEPGEDPRDTAERELLEELGHRAGLVATVADVPLFVTSNQTLGAGAHTDVSLWYVVAGDAHMWLEPDPREFDGHRWQSFESVLEADPAELGLELQRFVRKLMERLSGSTPPRG